MKLVITVAPQPDGTTALRIDSPPGTDREWVLRVLAAALTAITSPPAPAPGIEVPAPEQQRVLLAPAG